MIFICICISIFIYFKFQIEIALIGIGMSMYKSCLDRSITNSHHLKLSTLSRAQYLDSNFFSSATTAAPPPQYKTFQFSSSPPRLP